MSIDFDLFYDWCSDRFGEQNLRVRSTSHGMEICTHSYFAKQKLGVDDRKYHLWMSPSGGKKKLAGGAYRCWLTDAMGSLVGLVAEWDHVDFEEAEEMLTGSMSLRSLERKVHEFFGVFEEEIAIPEPEVQVEMALPEYSFLIDKLPPGHFWRARAKQYLNGRKLPSEGLYVCTDGDLRNRIIIPYYDSNGKLIWWNGRTMSDNKKVLRYAKPSGDSAHILYLTKWPDPGTKIYVMEGELDAITLSLADFIGCACGGKYLSEAQIEILRGHPIVLAFDADESGRQALIDCGTALLGAGFPNVSYIRPPKVYKDWNKLLVERNIQTVKGYIDQFEKPFTSATTQFLLSQRL